MRQYLAEAKAEVDAGGEGCSSKSESNSADTKSDQTTSKQDTPASMPTTTETTPSFNRLCKSKLETRRQQAGS